MACKKYKFLITAGGTGGHILPGLSIYNLLKAGNHEVRFICRKKDYSFIEDLKKIKTDILFFPGTGMRRRLALENILFIFHLTVNFIRSLWLFLTFYPDAVIGMGGYLTFPILSASVIFRVPFFLCEQNSYPGIVNRIFRSRARMVFINFEYSAKFFPVCKLTGNPLREQMKKKISLKQAHKFFNFKKKKKVLLIMGGSQGAQKINQAFEKVIPVLDKYNIIWLVGMNNYHLYKRYQRRTNIRIFKYLKEMNYALKTADLAVSRAGAMSISELSFFGLPALFIPLEQASDNHQYINADIIVKLGGGEIIEEKLLNDKRLFKKIEDMTSRRSVLLKYKKKIFGFHHKESEKEIVEEIYNQLKGPEQCQK